MQKFINVIALLSGLTSLGLISGSAYLLLNKDAMIEDAKAKVTVAVTEAVTGALPGLIQKSVSIPTPKLPKVTGGAIPQTTGLPIPKF